MWIRLKAKHIADIHNASPTFERLLKVIQVQLESEITADNFQVKFLATLQVTQV